jgi:hypothetical protein
MSPHLQRALIRKSVHFFACSAIVAWVASTSSARAQFAPEHVIDSAPGEVAGVHAADLDGDGDLDVIACRTGGTTLAWYQNLGGGQFGPATPFPAQPLGATEAITIDVGADGDMDVFAAVVALVTPFGNYYRVDLYVNQGGGNFATPTIIQPMGGPITHMEVGDFEGDGDLDLFVARGVTVSVTLFQSGLFGSPIDITQSASGLRDFRVPDVDGDGYADLVYASLGLGQILWFRNPGSATLFGGPFVIDGSLPGASGVDAAQIDNDGLIDVVGAGWLGSSQLVRWTGYLGSGMFGSPHPITNAGSPERVLCRTIDGDGDRDVFVGTLTAAWWQANDGQGNFGSPQPISASGDFTRAMAAADMDGGGIDLLLGTVPVGGGNGRILFFRNLIQTFTSFCPGDGSGTPCPCGNSGAAENGCASSVNALGAHVSGNGIPSLSNDTVVLTGSGMPNSSALYFQGTTRVLSGNGAPFGDGLRCAGGTIVRLGTKTNTGGSSAYPVAGDVHISIKGANAPGNVREYQVWYRNAAAFCTSSTYNLTNGVETTWVP